MNLNKNVKLSHCNMQVWLYSTSSNKHMTTNLEAYKLRAALLNAIEKLPFV